MDGSRTPVEEKYVTLAREGLARGLITQSSFGTDASAEAAAATTQRFIGGDRRAPIYARIGNPNVNDLEDVLQALEGPEVVAMRFTSCGMAAVSAALQGSLKAGDHIVVSKHLFGASTAFIKSELENYRVRVTWMDDFDPKKWKKAIRQNTKLFFFETPSNPLLHVADIKGIARVAHERDILVVVDGSMVMPFTQRPLRLGADILCTSLTKWVSGGDHNAGIVMISKQGAKRLRRHDPQSNNPAKNKYRIIGFLRGSDAPSPVIAFSCLKQLLTARQNYQQHCDTAQALAEDLHANGYRVLYPGHPSHPHHAVAKKQMAGTDGAMKGGGVLSVFCESKKKAFAAINRLMEYEVSPETNFGQPRTHAAHQRTTTYAAFTESSQESCGITDDLVRVGAGLEDREYLRTAFADAFGYRPLTSQARRQVIEAYRANKG